MLLTVMLAPSIPMAGLWLAYDQSNLMGQAIVLGQLVISVVVWSVMIGKRQELSTLATVARRFRQVFDASPDVLDIFFQRRKSDNPMMVVYEKTSEKLVKLFDPEARAELLNRRDTGRRRTLTTRDLALVKGAAEQQLSEQIIRIERGMNMLATGATATPLIGLLGTVWGVLDAFQAMNDKGSALLSDVAPGISSALLTTVIGLLVAIPSTVGYNFLQGRVRRLTIELDGFVDEMLGRIACEYQGRED